MQKIYITTINEKLNFKQVYKLRKYISNYKQRKLRDINNLNLIKRTILSDVFVRFLICNELNVKNKDIKISLNKYGKPTLISDLLWYNISHTGNFIICALGDNNIGIDIELRKYACYNKLVKRFFTNSEYDVIKDLNEMQKSDIFFKLWTLKESFFKMFGLSVFSRLNKICFAENLTNKDFSLKYLQKIYYFKQFKINNDCFGALSSKNSIKVQMNYINIGDVIKSFEAVI